MGGSRKANLIKSGKCSIIILASLRRRYFFCIKLNMIRKDPGKLANDEYGSSIEEHAENLSLAGKKAKALNICSVIIAACFYFVTDLFEYTFTAMLVTPVIAVILLRTSKGLIHLKPEKGSEYPSVNTAFFVACGALFIKALRGFDIDNQTNIWAPALIIAIAATLAVTLNNKEADINQTGGAGILVGVILCSFAYGYGAVVISNCYYDRSEPEVINASVVDKSVGYGKSITYCLNVTPWGRHIANEEIFVSHQLYESVEVGQHIHIYFREGRFNIPWYFVSDK